METGIKSSFIPQAPITPVRTETRQRGGGFDFFILFALVIFVASATLAVGVFLYSQFLSTSAASKLAQLERAKQAFEPALIRDLTRLDDRMRAADVVLSAHVAPTTMFRLLEELTLQTVSFSSFDYSSGIEGAEVSMKGVAQSVNSIALQADLLSKSGIISNPIFSNINRQVDGVHFDFSASVNVAALRFTPLQEQNMQMPINDPRLPQQQQQQPASPFGVPEEQQQQSQQQPSL